MGNYNVEFTVDDVVRKLEEVKAMCNGGKDNFLRTFTHEEGGRLGSQRNFLTALLEPIISKEEESMSKYLLTRSIFVAKNDAVKSFLTAT